MKILELKTLIRNTEERIVDYKNILKDIGQNKKLFLTDDESLEFYKSYVRDMKNKEEINLKKLVDERKFENENLNPTFCYKY